MLLRVLAALLVLSGACSGDGDPACEDGAACTPASACHGGRISCASGSARCQDTGERLADGAACPDGLCAAGECRARTCSPDQPCQPENPCATGLTACASPAAEPTCTFEASKPDSTECGEGKVCVGGACLPPHEPTVTFERLDSSGDCAGLVPASAGAPVTVTVVPAAGSVCGGGLSDGTGHVALAARRDVGTTWRVFAGDGSPRGSFSGWPLESEPSGWHALEVSSGPDLVVDHLVVSPGADTVGRTLLTVEPEKTSYFRAALCEDPRGGSVGEVAGVDLFHNHFHAVRVVRLDASGEVRCSTYVGYGSAVGEPRAMACGVSNRGEALHVTSMGTGAYEVRWTDGACGSVASGFVEYADLAPGGLWASMLEGDWSLEPLLDGGIAIRIGEAWTGRLAHLGTAVQPAPPWLAAREGYAYRFTRGNRGYAFFPAAGAESADCTQAVELLAPSGRLCGRIALHEEGTGCTTGVVDQGWDGTIVQQSGKDACTYRWWPGLLAGD